MSTIKRVYLYLVSLITLGIFVAGGQILLTLIFGLIRGANSVQVQARGFNQQQLSLGLAMLVIGGVLWYLFWRTIQKQVSSNPDEVGSAIRKLYLNFILVVAAFTGLNMAATFLNWLFVGLAIDQFSAEVPSTLIVAACVWYFYWRIGEREGQPSETARTLRRWYVYILSVFSLISLSVWLALLISRAILALPIWGGVITGSVWTNSLSRSLSWVLIAGVSWLFHWFRMARADNESTLRQVYFYLLAIPGGAIAGLAALIATVYRIIVFVLGIPGVTPAANFQVLGWTIPTMLVAAVVWGYHQRAAVEEASESLEQRQSARRVYLYLMSFIGLGTLVSGLIVLIGLLLELLTSGSSTSSIASPGWWPKQLGISLSLLLVALPVWLYYWNRVLKLVTENSAAERIARSRRIFIYVIVGVGIITLAADLVNIVYQLLNGVLQSNFGVEVYHGIKWSLQSLIVAVPVLWYHWQILRQDQRLGAEQLQMRKAVTILAGESAQGLVSLIEKKLGSRVRQLLYLGQAAEELPALSEEEADRLVTEIRAAPGNRVEVVLGGGKVTILPYREK